jgi:hypothetical protein
MTLHEGISLAIELLKVIAWPSVIGVIAWRKGPEILKLIGGRAIGLDILGVKATIGAAEEQQKMSR